MEHKIFESLKAPVKFESKKDLDDLIIKLSEKIGKTISYRNPIMDGTLPDGLRINIVYGEDISKNGSNFTIRKFSETPLSVLQLIEFGTFNYLMAAYFWICLHEGMNCFIAGETASGKTTTIILKKIHELGITGFYELFALLSKMEGEGVISCGCRVRVTGEVSKNRRW